jgi:hypothetical protein
LASILVGEECSALRLGPMTSGEIAASAHWTGGSMIHRIGLDSVGKILYTIGNRTLVPRSWNPYPVALPIELAMFINKRTNM